MACASKRNELRRLPPRPQRLGHHPARCATASVAFTHRTDPFPLKTSKKRRFDSDLDGMTDDLSCQQCAERIESLLRIRFATTAKPCYVCSVREPINVRKTEQPRRTPRSRQLRLAPASMRSPACTLPCTDRTSDVADQGGNCARSCCRSWQAKASTPSQDGLPVHRRQSEGGQERRRER